MHRIRIASLLLVLTPLLATAADVNPTGDSIPASAPAPVRQAMKSFSPARLAAHDKYLSSDRLEGRGPGTRGEKMAMEYMAAQFKEAGLQPAGENGTYFQRVPLIGVSYDPAKSNVAFTKTGAPPMQLKYLDDFVSTDESQTASSALDSELVFVGHGVIAPEYKWDDYKGLDTRGKTLVMLVDDPPANAKEPELFKGKARTYYGRWTYKYETGAQKHARGVILIHTDEAAGYPWAVVRNSWGAERSYVKLAPNAPASHFSAWVTQPIAAQLFKHAGLDLAAMTKAAASRDFKPVSLGGWKLSGTIASKIRNVETANVIGKLAGSDPKLRDQAILYTAHHDHLGVGKADERGDTIYNGALDNGSGCAVLIEMARAWAATNPKPKRSIYFASVAAEEQGLLGSAWLGQHPPIPSGRIALNFNYDMLFEYGRVRDVTMNGVERTNFLPAAQKITKAMDLRIIPDPEPEQGHYYRSDHFSLGKVGIPAFSIDPGQDVIGKPAGWGAKQSSEFREKHYHQPSDEYDPKWDWTEAVQMAQLGFWMGWEAANAPDMPNWNAGDEFRAVRDKSLAKK
jgi:Zn-dependent M28 family amino/carboxypeptidase